MMKTTKQLARELGHVRERKLSTCARRENQKKESYQRFSYLIVLDFESTCWERDKTKTQEIIEFPAVLMNTKTGLIESEFHFYVQPQEHPTLSSFCHQLTGILQDQVDEGIPLSLCLRKFSHWLNKLSREKKVSLVGAQGADSGHSSVNLAAMVTWSDWDLGVCFHYELKRKQIPKAPCFNQWIDLRATYTKFYGRKPKGLNGALQDVGIEFKGRQHSGLDDSRNTAALAWRMIQDGCLMQITKSLVPQVSTNIGCTEPQAYALKKRLIPQKKSLKEITRAAEDLETGDSKVTFTCYSDGEVKHEETLISRSTSSSYSSTPGLKLRNPNIPSSKHTFEKGNNSNSSRVLLKRQAIFTPEKTTSAKCLRLSAARNSTPTGQHSNGTHMTISKKQPTLGLDEVTSTFSDEAFGIGDKMDSLTSTSASTLYGSFRPTADLRKTAPISVSIKTSQNLPKTVLTGSASGQNLPKSPETMVTSKSFRSFKNPQESATTGTSLRTPQNKARLAFTAQNNTASMACTTPQNTASVAFNTPQNTASVAFNTPQNTACVAFNTPQSIARVAFSALHNTLNVALNTPTNTTSATFNTPTNTTSATFNTPTNTTSATFSTPTNTTSATFNTPLNITSATFHTPLNAASVAIDTSQNTTSMVLKTPQNTANMPSKTPLNTASMFFKTPQNTAGVAFNTPQNNASVALKTSKNTTCRAFNTLQNSASVAFNTPQNTTSVPLKTPQNTTSVPLKTPQNTTSAPFKTPQNTTSAHFKTPQNTASLAFKTPLNPSARSMSCRTPQSMPAATSTMKVTPPLCKCGRRAKRRMVQNPGPNTGRWFFSCVRGVANSANSKASGCGYFQWEHTSAVVSAGRVSPAGRQSFYRQTMGLGNSVTYPVTPVLQVHGSLKTQLR